MKPVTRDEVLGLADYEAIRDRFRARVIEEKRARRVALGDKATALFENHDTVLLQIQEMLRTERITRESAVMHEIETYNHLVPGDDELSATVMIEIPDPATRDVFLAKAVGFQKHLAIVVDGGEPVRATWEKSRELEDTASAVNYVRFPLGPKGAAHIREKKKDARVELLVDHPAYHARVTLGPATLASLADDLAEPAGRAR
jgi:hypothetical protein